MIKKYCIWNNKGGVGKTFLTYLLATEYANENQDKDVIVVDMCPQANISEMLLGGDGKGQSNLDSLSDKEITIASYIQNRYKKGRDRLLGNESSYFVKVSDYNKNLPNNILLVPGDTNLDICSILISEWGASSLRNSWKKSRLVLNDLIGSFISNSNVDRDKVFFIDCNPSFSPYTELAIIASERLIVPCTADHASIRGLNNVFYLLYDFNHTGDIISFSEKAKEENILLPKVFRVILNKSRSHDKNASKAFLAIQKELSSKILNLRKKDSNYFCDKSSEPLNVKDGNTLAAVLNFKGSLLSKIEVKTHRVYGKQVQIDAKQKNALLKGINPIVKSL